MDLHQQLKPDAGESFSLHHSGAKDLLKQYCAQAGITVDEAARLTPSSSTHFTPTSSAHTLLANKDADGPEISVLAPSVSIGRPLIAELGSSADIGRQLTAEMVSTLGEFEGAPRVHSEIVDEMDMSYSVNDLRPPLLSNSSKEPSTPPHFGPALTRQREGRESPESVALDRRAISFADTTSTERSGSDMKKPPMSFSHLSRCSSRSVLQRWRAAVEQVMDSDSEGDELESLRLSSSQMGGEVDEWSQLPLWFRALWKDMGRAPDKDIARYVNENKIPCLMKSLLDETTKRKCTKIKGIMEGTIAQVQRSSLLDRHNAAVAAALAILPRGIRRGVPASPSLLPLPGERDQLHALATHCFSEDLTDAQSELVWNFRHYLAAEGLCLPHILRTVDWDHASQREEANKLLHKWHVLSLPEICELLGPSFKGMTKVRDVAVDVLDDIVLTAESLLQILPQLVQALKHDEYPVQGALFKFLMAHAVEDYDVVSQLHWCLNLEQESLWLVHKAFLRGLKSNEKSVGFIWRMEKEMILLETIQALYDEILEIKSRSDKLEYLKGVLCAKDCRPIVGVTTPLPVKPSVNVTGTTDAEARVFKSAMTPIIIPFVTDTGDVVKVIYKEGDDLRQDCLVVQLIDFCDKLWKKKNLDLCLSPYAVLPTSRNDGLVEIVPDAVSMSKVTKEGILKFLQRCNPNGDLDSILQTYIKSCAGYCVISYVLGIGDRHLDNLMMRPDGRLLHVDFGFCFGKDPKPYPPAMKISSDMVEAMGGIHSPLYNQFVDFVVAGYRILRNQGMLVSNLLSLMSDADLPDLRVDKAREALHFDMTNSQATEHIQKVVKASTAAFMPEMMDIIHDLATKW